MKRAVREAVDQRDVQPVLVEKAAERLEAVAFEQLARLARGQAKTETERCRGREPRFQRGREVSQVGEDRVPAVGGMDVGAVGEVEASRFGEPQRDHRADARRSRTGSAAAAGRKRELRRLAEEATGILEDDLLDQRFRMTPAPHLHDEPRHGDRDRSDPSRRRRRRRCDPGRSVSMMSAARCGEILVCG